MNKLLCALSAAMLAITAVSAARADTFSPGAVTTKFAGTVTVDHGVMLMCNMTLTIQTNSAATAGIVSTMDLTGGLCGLITFHPFFTLDSTTTTAMTIEDVYATSAMPQSPCGPTDVPVGWSGGAQSITFNNALVGPSGCMLINGTISRVSGPALTITP